MIQNIKSMLQILTVLGTFASACAPQTSMQAQNVRSGSAGRCAGPECTRTTRDAAQFIQFTTIKNPTNSQTIELSWNSSAEDKVFSIDVATDPECRSIKESRSTRAYKMNFSDLAEGTWFFCLHEQGLETAASLSSRSLQILIDRKPPAIKVASNLSLVSGSSLEIQVEDDLSYECTWSTPQTEGLSLVVEGATKVTATSKDSGDYAVAVECTDAAGNASKQEIMLAMTAKTEAASEALACNAGTDLSLSLPGNLSGTATGAASLTWSKVSGPGNITFSNPNILAPQVTASLAGVYILRLTARSAGGQEIQDDVQLTWVNAERTLKSVLTRVGIQIFSYLQTIRTSGNYAFVAREDVGLSIVNISNPAMLSVVTNNIGNGATGWAAYLQIVGNIAYVANWERGLTAVNIANPLAPVVLHSLPLTNAATLHIEGNYAYVGLETDDALGGLAIVNITNPSQMTLVKTLATGGAVGGIAKVGNYVYLAHRELDGGFTGLKIVNVTNMNNPSVVQTFNRSSMEEIKVVGRYAFITAGVQGLEIFDVNNPASPVSLSVTPLAATTSYAVGVDVVEKYAFVTDYDGARLYALDISNKSMPTIVNSFRTSQDLPALWVHVAGRYAYLSTEARAMEIIEVFQ